MFRRPVQLAALLLLLLGEASCGRVTRVSGPRPAEPMTVVAGSFPHEILDEVLSRFVDDQGLVEYEALKAHPEALQRYLLFLELYSPRNKPELFPTDADRLAYYINAHNAFVLYGVVEHYPIQSVNDVKSFVELMRGFGFFYGQKFRQGGEEINLYNQVNKLLRKFGDPRIHAALNCGALGCPILARRAYRPAELEQQLDQAMRHFVSEKRNLEVDDAQRTVYLSDVFRLYADDFRGALHQKEASVLDYITLFSDTERQRAVERARRGGYRLVFREYDWRLNVRGAIQGPAT